MVADIIRRVGHFEIAGFLDDDTPDRKGSSFYGAPVLGGQEELPRLGSLNVQNLAIAFGNNQCRLNKANVVREAGFELPCIIDPSAIVAQSVSVGDGAVIAPNAVVNADVNLFQCVIINSGSVVEHDCQILDGAHIAPGVTLAGHVSVGRCTLIGAGSTVRDRVSIGKSSVIGIASAVVGDIPDNVVAYGVPARVIRKNSDARSLDGHKSE